MMVRTSCFHSLVRYAVGTALAGALSIAHAGDLVISQIYGGGGNTGAPYRQDFIELFNRSANPIDISGWSVQYAGATSANWQRVLLPSGVLQPGQYLLIGGAQGAVGAALPALDAASTINFSATQGKVALVATTELIPAGLACPSGPAMRDFVGYGGANCFEGAGPASAPATATAALRVANGCADVDSNAQDFGVAAPFPRNSLAPLTSCSVVAAVRIRDIQGRAHRSPWISRSVANVPGIVTARRADGFFMQDPFPDDDPGTSEGIFVATGAAPTVAVGDAVEVSGLVVEARPGAATNLSTTRISTPAVRVISSGNALPAPTIIGAGGRIPPNKVIDDDATGDIETSGSFDPMTDGIDFYESLEGMRVTVQNAVAVGPSSAFGEIPVVGDNGTFATLRSRNGGLVIAPDDFNPERILLDNALVGGAPAVNTGDSLGTVTGIIDYAGGSYRLLLTERPIVTPGPAVPEQTIAQRPDQLAIASFNVQNLSPNDPPSKFDRLGAHIVASLKSPDVIALMEVQDNNGEINDGVVAADRTLALLVASISAAGGPAYAYRQINPVDRQDGGAPGGNIRIALLFNPARVQFVDRPGGGPTTAVDVIAGASGPQLSASPGRVDPANPVFANSRKPLAAEIEFNGHRVFLIANHFNSKGGDAPLFGREQPPSRVTDAQRIAQASVVANFVQRILAQDARAKVVVMGDLNDFEFSQPLATLKSVGLVDLVERLPPDDRYTFNFAGNSQALDHILVSPELAARAMPELDIVHINADFANAVSDHDPEVVRLTLPRAPTNEVTAALTITQTRPRFNVMTQTYNGSIQLTNTTNQTIAGPLYVLVGGLPEGVILENAAGNAGGMPYVIINTAQLAPGRSTQATVRYKAATRPAAATAVRVFSVRIE